MFVIEVIPLTPLPPNVPQILSYFFDQEIAKGASVEVPLGSRTVPAIVVACTSLEQQKIAVKKTGFQLKKLSKVTNPAPLVSDLQLKIIAWLSRHYFSSLSAAMKMVLPSFFNKKGYLVPDPTIPARQAQPARLIAVRAKDMPALVKEEIGKTTGQVLVLAPEMGLARHLHEQISDSVLLTSDTGAKDYKTLWKSVSTGEAKVVCATRVGLFLPFKNLELIILDDPDHEAYKSDMAPRYVTPDAARKVAELYRSNLITTTPQPSVTEKFHIREKALAFEDRRPALLVMPEIMNMVLEIKTGNFSIFAKSFQEAIFHAISEKQKVLLFSSRRAYAGVMMCSQCNLVFQCKNCHIPLRVHKTSETILVCYHCSAYHTPPAFCPNCSSAKLKSTGIAGSQKIKEELDALLAQHNLPVSSFILDSDLVLDDKDEKTLLKRYAETPNSILISTQMIFSHRHTLHFDMIGIPTADGLITAPDFRNEERFISSYQKLLDFGPQRLIVQTYHPEATVFTAISGRGQDEFVDQELAARKILGYPPFSRVVKLSFKHRDQKKALTNARLLAEKLSMAIQQLKLHDQVGIAGPSPATIAQENNIFTYAIWLKIAPSVERLDTILKYIPNGWIVDVDPSSSA